MLATGQMPQTPELMRTKKAFGVDIDTVQFHFRPVPIRDPENPDVRKLEAEVDTERAVARQTDANPRKLAAETQKTRAEVGVVQQQVGNAWHRAKA